MPLLVLLTTGKSIQFDKNHRSQFESVHPDPHSYPEDSLSILYAHIRFNSKLTCTVDVSPS